MANGVINGINWVIRALNKIKFDIPDWVPLLGGKTFGFNISTLNTVSLPRLYNGGAVFEDMAVRVGDYSGASTNPEIISPRNMMEESFDKVLSRHEGNEQPISLNLTVNVSNARLGQILLEDLRNMKRRTGKDIEALVGG